MLWLDAALPSHEGASFSNDLMIARARMYGLRTNDLVRYESTPEVRCDLKVYAVGVY